MKAAGDDVGVRECNRKIRLLKDKYNEITQKAGLNAHYDRMSVVKSGKNVDVPISNTFKKVKIIGNKTKNDIIFQKKSKTAVGSVHSIGKIDIENINV